MNRILLPSTGCYIDFTLEITMDEWLQVVDKFWEYYPYATTITTLHGLFFFKDILRQEVFRYAVRIFQIRRTSLIKIEIINPPSVYA